MPTTGKQITVTVSKEFYWWIKHYQAIKGYASTSRALQDIIEIGQRIVNEGDPLEVKPPQQWGGTRNPEGYNEFKKRTQTKQARTQTRQENPDTSPPLDDEL